MEQQINDLLKQVFTLDGNGRVALRMLIAGGLSAKWKDPVNTVADLPNTDPEGVTRVVLDDNGAIKPYTFKNGAWTQHAGGASYTAGNGINIASYVVSIDADTAKGLAFFSGKLGLNIDTNTLAFTAGVLGVKSGVYASVSHTHTASNISDWATAFATSFNSNFGGKTTDDLTEGSTKKYFANSLARASISVSATGLSYDNVNGIISITSGYGIPTSSQITHWDEAYTNSHTHSNKTLLDTYTQTEANLADAVLNKHTHSNKAVLDLIEQAFTTALKSNYDTAYTNSHTHSNKTTLDGINQSLSTTNSPTFAGITITGLSGILKASAGVVAGGAGLADLSGVTISSPASGDVLKYNGSAWINGQITASAGFSAESSRLDYAGGYYTNLEAEVDGIQCDGLSASILLTFHNTQWNSIKLSNNRIFIVGRGSTGTDTSIAIMREDGTLQLSSTQIDASASLTYFQLEQFTNGYVFLTYSKNSGTNTFFRIYNEAGTQIVGETALASGVVFGSMSVTKVDDKVFCVWRNSTDTFGHFAVVKNDGTIAKSDTACTTTIVDLRYNQGFRGIGAIQLRNGNVLVVWNTAFGNNLKGNLISNSDWSVGTEIQYGGGKFIAYLDCALTLNAKGNVIVAGGWWSGGGPAILSADGKLVVETQSLGNHYATSVMSITPVGNGISLIWGSNYIGNDTSNPLVCIVRDDGVVITNRSATVTLGLSNSGIYGKGFMLSNGKFGALVVDNFSLKLVTFSLKYSYNVPNTAPGAVTISSYNTGTANQAHKVFDIKAYNANASVVVLNIDFSSTGTGRAINISQTITKGTSRSTLININGAETDKSTSFNQSMTKWYHGSGWEFSIYRAINYGTNLGDHPIGNGSLTGIYMNDQGSTAFDAMFTWYQSSSTDRGFWLWSRNYSARTNNLNEMYHQRQKTSDATTETDNFSMFLFKRESIVNITGGTLQSYGAIVTYQNISTQTVGTLDDRVDIARFVQNTFSTGNIIAGSADGGTNWHFKVNHDGRLFTAVPNSANADYDLMAGQTTFYLDETNNVLKFRVKYSDGTTLKTGTVSLA